MEEEEEEVEKVDEYLNENDSDDDIPYIDGFKGYKPLLQKSESLSGHESASTMDISKTDDPTGQDEEQADGGISLKVWKRYFRAGASVFLLFILILVLILSQVVTSGSDYFVNYWTQMEFRRSSNESIAFTTEEYLYMYGFLIIGVTIVCIFFCSGFYIFFSFFLNSIFFR